MRHSAYAALSALPSKAFAGLTSIGGIAATLFPEAGKEWAARLMTPDEIRFWGVIVLTAVAIYGAALWLLRPKTVPQLAASSPMPQNTTHGEGSHIFSGTFHGAVNFGSTDKEKDRPAPIGLWAMNSDLDYVPGEVVGGIKWEKGYAHTIIKISNPTDETYSELNITINPELPIIRATCQSDIAEAKIGIVGAPMPTAQVYIQPDGSHRAYSQEPHPDNIVLGPPYRLYCPHMPGRSEIRVDLAVVVPVFDVMAPKMWSEERRGPAHIDMITSYKAYGKARNDSSRLSFSP